MKLSDLKPCAGCGGPLRSEGMGNWYEVRVSSVMLNPKSAQRVMGLANMFNGHLGIAEVFSPDTDDAVVVLGEKEPALYTTVHVCFECYCEKRVVEITERVAAQTREAESVKQLAS